jgi:NitT/TauT family transport system substrate-binding protein
MLLAWAGVRVPALRIIAVILPVTVLASSCHVPGTGSPGGASGTGPITVAVIPGIDNAPLRVALQDGLFQQHGLNVTVKTYQSLGAEFQALTSGQVQIAAGDYTGFLYEETTRRASLQLIADEYDAASNSVAILTWPGSGITTVQQLEGQSGVVATPPAALPATLAQFPPAAPYNIETLAAEQVLQNDGISPSSITWEQLPMQDMIGALGSHQVKAILVTEPYILEAEQQLGAIEVMNASTGVTSGLPLSGYFSLSPYAHANPAAVLAFQTALDQAQADCAQRGPVQAVLPSLTGMSARDAALITLGTYPISLNFGQIQRVAQLMYDSGMVPTPVNMSVLTSG